MFKNLAGGTGGASNAPAGNGLTAPGQAETARGLLPSGVTMFKNNTLLARDLVFFRRAVGSHTVKNSTLRYLPRELLWLWD